MSPHFRHATLLAWGVKRLAEYTTDRGELTRYSVTLVAWRTGAWRTVRLCDNAHGVIEMHRHTLSGGKQAAEIFHYGTASEAYNDARLAVASGWEEMIAGWQR